MNNKVKLKLPRKSFVKLITYVSRLDHTNFININNIDRLNIRTMYISVMMMHEKYRNDKDYHRAQKNNSISIDVNYFGTLQKILNQLQLEGVNNYESNYLLILSNQATPQINQQIFINESINTF